MTGLGGSAGTRVRSSLSVGQSDIDETLGVQESLSSTALGLLLLLLLFNLRSLRLDLSGTSERSVNFSL